MEVVLEVLGMLSPNLGYICVLRRFRCFFVGNHDSFCRFLKHVKVLVETSQSGFTKLRPYRQQLEMQ